MGIESTTLALKYLLLLLGTGALVLHFSRQPSLQFGDPDDFVVVLTSYAGFESRIAAGRASRQGLRTVVVTNELRKEAKQLRKAPGETWLTYKGRHMEDVAPFVAAKHLGRSFRYMLIGEDDTLFFRDGAATAVRDADSAMPYYISDEAWFVNQEGKRHYAKAEAPQCVPCNYSGDVSQLPPHLPPGCPCNVSGTIPEGFCGPHKMPSMSYSAHGGPGYILSAGLFQKVSQATIESCVAKDDTIYLARCLWKEGIGMTDADPLWHPQGLTFFDPTPPPYLTHENIMEKTAHTLGRLLRQAAGMCAGICQAEMEHMTSLHLNAARIGFTEDGERRVGPYKDAGQREFVGQVLLSAVSRFYSTHILRRDETASSVDLPTDTKGATTLSAAADDRLADALQVIQAMGNFFNAVDVAETEASLEKGRPLSTMERAKGEVAAAIARQALDLIVDQAVLA